MRMAILLDGLNQDRLRSILLDYSRGIRYIPEDVPLELGAFSIHELNEAALEMGRDLERALLTTSKDSIKLPKDVLELAVEIKLLLIRYLMPKNYVFKVYPLPTPQVALVYTKEDFTREFYQQFGS